MKPLFSLLFLFFAVNALGQIPFPKGFHLVKGEMGSGLGDICTNGKYTFVAHMTGWLEREEDLVKIDGFHQTKDSLYWCTGKEDGLYFYKVYNGELVELYSENNDKEFSDYSKWLLATMRKYRHSEKLLFPPHLD